MKKFECYCGCGKKSLKVKVGNVNYYSRECVERIENKAHYPFKLLTNKEYQEFHKKPKVRK